MLSQRAKHLIDQPQPLVEAHFTCQQDPYSQDNPKGYLGLGTAENGLLDDLMRSRLQHVSEVSASQLHYQPPFGSLPLRQAVSYFVANNFSLDVSAEHIVVASGCSALLEMLAYALFDEQDQILIPTPFYSGFMHDFSLRFGVEVVPVDCFDTNYRLLTNKLEEAINAHERVKALLICSPINPLGYCWPVSDLEALADIVVAADIHLIADEIYANSVFGEAEFYSVHGLIAGCPALKKRVHSLYGMAKDFGLSGFKVGYFFSYNESVLTAMRNLAYFHSVSSQTQHACVELLEDADWCRQLKSVNQQLLRQAFGNFQQQLTALGLSCFNSDAGVFTWLDLRDFLSQPSFEAETELFMYLLHELKINISPGQYFMASEPGFFRVCYAQPAHYLEQFFLRLATLKRMTGSMNFD